MSLSALCGVLSSCGTDAERRFAGLSKHDVSTSAVAYRVRYQAPPWEALEDDALVTGARKSVDVGGALRDVVADSASVLTVRRQSNLSGPDELFLAKYRLEVVALACTDAELSVGSSCAQWLADTDFAARSKSEDVELSGGAPRADTNDFDQPYYELVTQTANRSRYRRIAYFETSDPRLALRFYLECNPDPTEIETTNMLRAFEVLRPNTDAGVVGNRGEGGP